MNFKIDGVSKEQVTVLVGALSYAIKKDHQVQNVNGELGRFSLNLYHKKLQHYSPTVSNRTMLSVGRITAKAIAEGTRTSESLISADDAALLIEMLLVGMKQYEWKAVRAAIAEAGPKFAHLIDAAPQPVKPACKNQCAGCVLNPSVNELLEELAQIKQALLEHQNN